MQAAEADDPTACLRLGAMAEAGEGKVAADAPEAAAYYCKAAQLGSTSGAHAWAFALEHGLGGWRCLHSMRWAGLASACVPAWRQG